MGWQNPDVPWSELEEALSGRPVREGSSLHGGPEADGGDAPAWSAHRGPYEPPEALRTGSATGSGTVPHAELPYAELHCHSHFSFLDGASAPEELVERAAELGLEAIALTDHDGMYGVVRFAEAARALGVRTVFGAELSLGLSAPQNGVADPEGEHLLLLARGPDGYRALCRVISAAQMRGGEKGRPVYDLDEVVADTAGKVVALTGCRKGAVRRALETAGPAAAAVALDELISRFGHDGVRVELTGHGDPTDTERNDALAALAAVAGVGTVATTAAHYATPDGAPLAATVAAVRARRGLDEIDPWLPAAGTAHLRAGTEMALRFEDRYPGAVSRAAELGRELAFELHLVAPDLPPFDVPAGETEASWLRRLTRIGTQKRYGSAAENPFAAYTVDRELEIIESKNFPGYFLIVHDIVDFCRRSGIFCQGRGSAANSAVCYALGITAVDAVRHGLLFERFLSPDRDGYPDIDLDIESGRREEAIQYVYRRYGRLFAAQVANVITYRPRSAVRDTARALGFSPGQQDAWSKRVERWHALETSALGTAGEQELPMPEQLVDLAGQLMSAPRHLGIHSGGMVICDRPVSEVVPVEWARMADRTVVQWDKEDCAAAGLVKFDLLGLGMLTALHLMADLVAEHEGTRIELHEIGESDPEVYAMLSRADSVGVFQVESRAQMATLPRLRPREFYDLVVEVALIRPGPIQGGSVHPYIRRRNKLETWEHDHELLRPALDKTLGIPLFQEQMMQIAVDVAGFTAAEADELRRAMGSKRSEAKMERLRGRFYDGMAANGITGELAEKIFTKMLAFANFGFPESHSISFAALVYYSAWFKLYHPAAFCAALLNAQPMGFYSPQSLVADARRHGVLVRRPDVNDGRADAILQADPSSTGGRAIRLGLSGVRAIGADLAGVIDAERAAGGPFADLADLARRVRLTGPQAEALATAGAFGCFGVDRREALWAAGVVAGVRPEHLPGTAVGLAAPALPGMTEAELTVSDVWATGVSPESHPVLHLRDRLDGLGAVRIDRLDGVGRRAGPDAPPRVLVGGLVTHRQRPATAGGVTFVNLEDESGMLNVTCSEGLWARYRSVALGSAALLVRGRLERSPEGVLNLVADRLQRMPLAVSVASRDFC
ncbi:error-prone DNA polymerase [Pseudonocardia nantongensis]|uniref:error-prone DNA polymerase n=1 Tax=Pseudonocardia nantongensis TaxID=1181885 RepID=UPI00397CA090